MRWDKTSPEYIEYFLAEKAARERWGDRVHNVNYKRRGGYLVFLCHPAEDAHVLLEANVALAREGSLPTSGSPIKRVRRKVTPKPAEESPHANLDHGDQGALYAPEAGSIPASKRSHHSAPTSPPVSSHLARAQKELEDAAGALVDQWSLIEVGGNVRREDRLSAERRLRRGITAVRALRLSGGR